MPEMLSQRVATCEKPTAKTSRHVKPMGTSMDLTLGRFVIGHLRRSLRHADGQEVGMGARSRKNPGYRIAPTLPSQCNFALIRLIPFFPRRPLDNWKTRRPGNLHKQEKEGKMVMQCMIFQGNRLFPIQAKWQHLPTKLNVCPSLARINPSAFIGYRVMSPLARP
jgi:hypothetical protein